MKEGTHLDRKSIAIIRGKTADWKELAKDCVCFANGVGGRILIGIENDSVNPSADQEVFDDDIENINRRIPSLTVNVGIAPKRVVANNGGQYIELTVHRSAQSVAGTTDGRYYMRVSDECRPIQPEDMLRLAADKNAFVWEEKASRRVPLSECDAAKFKAFVRDVRESGRVTPFVKDKPEEEIAEHYFLVRDGLLTNLGILWVGQRRDRAMLHYAPTIQFIKYDDQERKVFKRVWDDYDLNPKELINGVLFDIPDWNEFVEVADGMFRKNIHNYPPEVIRELVVNAIAHRNYTMRGDIFINLYPDRLEIHSPGLLPLGVTPSNILSQSVQRNRLLCKLLHDLKLMEKEGSGYDLVYALMLGNAKQPPVVTEGDDRVVVTLQRNILSNEVLRLMDRASKEFQLKQREVIALGIIAQSGGIAVTELANALSTEGTNGVSSWLGKLPSLGVIHSKGKTKGTMYFINPDYLKSADFVERTSLKRIEPHRLQELIYEDLRNYPSSSISEMNQRIGEEITRKVLKKKVDDMLDKGLLDKSGERKWRRYFIAQNE